MTTRPPKPTSLPEDTSWTCDWGACDNLTRCWRWSGTLGVWLPVCTRHRR